MNTLFAILVLFGYVSTPSNKLVTSTTLTGPTGERYTFVDCTAAAWDKADKHGQIMAQYSACLAEQGEFGLVYHFPPMAKTADVISEWHTPQH